MENRKVAAAVIAALAGSSVALAADQAAAPGAQDDQLQEIVVTGSNIPVAGTPDMPVVTVGPQQLEESGVTSNALEVLRKTVPSFAGRSNAGNSNASNTNQATGGGSQIQLRNLPTLVLLDGRRVTYSSINGSGGKNFVDVNMFPMAAIDHIEVLNDGASSVYGSDAIGGVVNIILKHDYQGFEADGRYAVTDDTGHYSERSASALFGTKFFDNTNLTVSANWAKTDPLFQNQRAFSSPDVRPAKGLPGSVGSAQLSPYLNSPSQINPVGTAATAPNFAALTSNGTYTPSTLNPTFDISPYVSMLVAQELKSATAEFDSHLIDDNRLTLFGNAVYSQGQSNNLLWTSLSNLMYTTTVPQNAPYNPVAGAVPGVAVGTTSTPQGTINTSNAVLGTLGLKGDITHNWNWEAGYTYSRSRLVELFTNMPFGTVQTVGGKPTLVPNLVNAIAGGYDANGNAVVGGAYSKVIGGFNVNGPMVLQPALDPFARGAVNPASLANLYGTERADTTASLGSLDAKIVGKLYQLPAGWIGVAAGASTRIETVGATPDQNSYQLSTDPTKHNWYNGNYFDPFAKSRKVTSYFAETRIPITGKDWTLPGLYALDLSLAGRSEHYSDAGTSTVPKIGIKWQPFDEQLTLRFAYSKSFAAPFLVDEYGPANFAQGGTPAGIILQPGQSAAALNGLNVYSGNTNNPDLKPALAFSRMFGVTFAPNAVKGLTVSVDYVNVFLEGFQAGVGAGTIFSSVDQYGSASPFYSLVSVGAAPGQPGSSQAPLAAPGGIYNYVTAPGYTGDLYILDHKINSGGLLEEAMDFSVNYDLKTDRWGLFSFSTAGTHLISTKESPTPGAPWFQLAGYSSNGNLFAGSAAKWSAYSTVDWNYHNFDFVVGNTFRSSMTDVGSANTLAWLANPANKPGHVAAYTSWDTSVSYGNDDLSGYAKGYKVTLGATNVFNRMPPLALLSYPEATKNSNADTSTYSPIGRLFFLTGSVHF